MYCLFVLIVVFRNSCWFVSSGGPRFGVVPVLCNREVWQSPGMTYLAVNDPNITSGFTFNTRSVSLASELRSFVVLRPSPEQTAPSAARYIGVRSGMSGAFKWRRRTRTSKNEDRGQRGRTRSKKWSPFDLIRDPAGQKAKTKRPDCTRKDRRYAECQHQTGGVFLEDAE